jgi:hypothetical protein
MEMRANTPQSVEPWQRCTNTYIATLPVLQFPFEQPPSIYAPERTILQLQVGLQVHAYLWCYLKREVTRGNSSSFDISSLSETRVQAMPEALRRLSALYRLNNARPASIAGGLLHLGQLLKWADGPEHAGRFEKVLSDPELALEALRGYHTYLRNLLQSHQLTHSTAGMRDQSAIACMSVIHGVRYTDDIEPLQARKGMGTEAPDTEDVQQFISTLQAIFDSASEMILSVRAESDKSAQCQPRRLRVSATDDSQVVELRERYGPLRLMELACVAFAGLAFVDSGANLAVLQEYEEPDDLQEQLAQPERINLTERVVKLRAGGKLVDVHLTSLTMTRLRTYLRLRQGLVTALGCGDIAPMFVVCGYGVHALVEPTTIRPLGRNFLKQIRDKVTAIGASLPEITLKQLRVYKQQRWVSRYSVVVTAKAMGHSVKTAIDAYSKAQAATRRSELSQFLDSLQKTVQAASEAAPERSSRQVIPIGSCTDHGQPTPSGAEVLVEPDCKKVQGCFFCDNYRAHADETDMRKLMSCRSVLKRIAHLQSDSLHAERVYTAVMDRIDALLRELKQRQPKVFEAARVEVEERGQLSRYWASKLSQIHLLGMAAPNLSPARP